MPTGVDEPVNYFAAFLGETLLVTPAATLVLSLLVLRRYRTKVVSIMRRAAARTGIGPSIDEQSHMAPAGATVVFAERSSQDRSAVGDELRRRLWNAPWRAGRSYIIVGLVLAMLMALPFAIARDVPNRPVT